MTSVDLLAAILWTGITLYAVLGGADFGGGFWDLFAGGPSRGAATRALIENAIGPVWEANHVWLIFGVVILWTGFPVAFTSVMTTLWIPLTLAALGIILRGSGFVFRKVAPDLATQRLFGATFALSSLLTPFFLGTVAGAVASGRVPLGNAQGDAFASWINPTSALGGALAVLACAHLAAVYLTADARRLGLAPLTEAFRRRALGSGVAVGTLSLAGLAVLAVDAPRLFAGLSGKAAGTIAVSAAAGLATLFALRQRWFVAARPLAAGAVAAVIWGWGLGQHPELLPGVCTLEQVAAHESALRATLLSLAVGAAIIVPSLWLLFALFQRPRTDSRD